MNTLAPPDLRSPARDDHASMRRRVESVKAAWAQGTEPDAGEALARYPELLADKSLVLDLAYEEYCLRQEAGEAPDAEAFCARFPAHRTALRRIIDAHRILQNDPDVLERPSRPAWPGPGDQVGEYTLIRELGRGAFARVFLATEASTGDRPVALKLTREVTGEARVLGRLEHPHVVPVWSSRRDQASGLTLVCMPYLGGATLQDVVDTVFPRPDTPPPARGRSILEAVRSRQVPEDPTLPGGRPGRPFVEGRYWEGVLHLGVQLADALAYVHSRGVCHRDLKPANVLLSPDGRPLLLDFNLSAAEEDLGARLGGTLPYMAPEQVEALLVKPADRPPVGPPADLFALGAVLFELLTGQQPFGPLPAGLPASQLVSDLLERQRAGRPRVRALNPRVPRAFAALVEQCLAVDPGDRPAGAEALAAGLRRCMPRLRPLGRWMGRHCRSLLAAAGVLLVTAGVAGWAWSIGHPSAARRYQSGQEALVAGRYAEAEERFRQALDAEPGRRDYQLARGRALLLLAEPLHGPAKGLKISEAMREFQAGGNIEQADAYSLACMAYCHTLLGEHEAAAALYSRALDRGFQPAAVLLNDWAFSCLHTGKLTEARALVDKALRRDPDLQAARYNRAMLVFRQWLANPAQPFPQNALVDMECALRGSDLAAELYADAGRMYAAAANAHPKHADWPRRATTLLQNAVVRGQDPRRLLQNPFVASLRSRCPEMADLAGLHAGPPIPSRNLKLVLPTECDR